jgi:hypothetical protein
VGPWHEERFLQIGRAKAMISIYSEYCPISKPFSTAGRAAVASIFLRATDFSIIFRRPPAADSRFSPITVQFDSASLAPRASV